jgi:hypothetical protein
VQLRCFVRVNGVMARVLDTKLSHSFDQPGGSGGVGDGSEGGPGLNTRDDGGGGGGGVVYRERAWREGSWGELCAGMEGYSKTANGSGADSDTAAGPGAPRHVDFGGVCDRLACERLPLREPVIYDQLALPQLQPHGSISMQSQNDVHVEAQQQQASESVSSTSSSAGACATAASSQGEGGQKEAAAAAAAAADDSDHGRRHATPTSAAMLASAAAGSQRATRVCTACVVWEEELRCEVLCGLDMEIIAAREEEEDDGDGDSCVCTSATVATGAGAATAEGTALVVEDDGRKIGVLRVACCEGTADQADGGSCQRSGGEHGPPGPSAIDWIWRRDAPGHGGSSILAVAVAPQADAGRVDSMRMLSLGDGE